MAPFVKVRPISSMFPVVVLYPVPETVSKPPLELNVKTQGPEGEMALTVGSLELMEAFQVLGVVSFVKVAEMTCALPSRLRKNGLKHVTAEML
jgi:hypothetical protein